MNVIPRSALGLALLVLVPEAVSAQTKFSVAPTPWFDTDFTNGTEIGPGINLGSPAGRMPASRTPWTSDSRGPTFRWHRTIRIGTTRLSR
jgi:hypothetical protein